MADLTLDYEPEMKPGGPDTVQLDRNYLIDAAIVRILKSKTELKVHV